MQVVWADYDLATSTLQKSTFFLGEQVLDIVDVKWRMPGAKNFRQDMGFHRYMGQDLATADRLLNARALESVYKSYEKSIVEDLIKKTNQVEESLPLHRMMYLLLQNEKREVMGFVRTFNGDPTRAPHPEAYLLPLERLILARGGKVPTELEALREKAKVDGGITLFEIGKLFIKGDNPDRLKVRQALKLWVQDMARANPGSIFIAHVASEAHRRLYEREFGFQILKAVEMPDTQGHEYILQVSAEDLFAALKR